ncbi:TPA: hypothetical protein ACH3X1_016040 [Trebouxia sp. C0004]
MTTAETAQTPWPWRESAVPRWVSEESPSGKVPQDCKVILCIIDRGVQGSAIHHEAVFRKTQPVQSQLKALLLRQHHVVLRTDGSKAVDEVADTTTVLAADPYQRLLIGQTRPVVFLMGLVSPDQNPDIDATAKSTLQENVIEERADFCRMIHAEAARAGKMVLEEEQSHEACTKNASYFHTKA